MRGSFRERGHKGSDPDYRHSQGSPDKIVDSEIGLPSDFESELKKDENHGSTNSRQRPKEQGVTYPRVTYPNHIT